MALFLTSSKLSNAQAPVVPRVAQTYEMYEMPSKKKSKTLIDIDVAEGLDANNRANIKIKSNYCRHFNKYHGNGRPHSS